MYLFTPLEISLIFIDYFLATQPPQLSPIAFLIVTVNTSWGLGQLNSTEGLSAPVSVASSVLQVRAEPLVVHTSHSASFGSRLKTTAVLESMLRTFSKQSEVQIETNFFESSRTTAGAALVKLNVSVKLLIKESVNSSYSVARRRSERAHGPPEPSVELAETPKPDWADPNEPRSRLDSTESGPCCWLWMRTQRAGIRPSTAVTSPSGLLQ